MVNGLYPTLAIVDDQDLVREGMIKALSFFGFKVVITAINGKDFLLQ